MWKRNIKLLKDLFWFLFGWKWIILWGQRDVSKPEVFVLSRCRRNPSRWGQKDSWVVTTGNVLIIWNYLPGKG